MSCKIRYRILGGAILEAAFGEVSLPAEGEAVVTANRMPGYHDSYPVYLDMIQDGQIVAREQLAIDADIAAILAVDQKPIDAAADFRVLNGWYTWTGQQAAEALRTGILNGVTKTQARAAIDTQFNGATTAAAIKAAAIAVLKSLSDAIIDSRDMGHQNEAKAIMYLRDINRV